MIFDRAPDVPGLLGAPQFVVDLRKDVFHPVNLKNGVVCPVCGRMCRERPNRLSYWMGVGLMAMYQYHKQNPGHVYCHIENLWMVLGFKPQRMRDVSRLKHWMLIEHAPPIPGTVVQGFWRVTVEGEKFLGRSMKVIERNWTFNDEVTRWGEKLVSIDDVMKSEPFNLDDLVALKGMTYFEQYFPHAYNWTDVEDQDETAEADR